MLRPAIRSLSIQPRRHFVSAVLLSRNWDRLTVSDLKKEARTRGLSPTGNKSLLIARIQEHEKSLSSVAAAPTTSVSTPPETPSVDSTQEGELPGVPLTSQAEAPTPFYLNVALPDAAYDPPEPAVQIPYAFDFLDSSPPVAEPSTEEPLPKMVVIGGVDTHHGGGPSHNLLDEANLSISDATSQPSPASFERGKGGLFDDMAEDMGLPPLKEMKNSFRKLFSS